MMILRMLYIYHCIRITLRVGNTISLKIRRHSCVLKIKGWWEYEEKVS